MLTATLGNLETSTPVAARQTQRQPHCESLEGDRGNGATQQLGQLGGRHLASELTQLCFVGSGPGGDVATGFLFDGTSGFFGHKNNLRVIKEVAHSKEKPIVCLQDFRALSP